MKLAAVSMHTVYGQVTKNIDELARLLNLLDKQAVDFALFPELNISGYIKEPVTLHKIAADEKRILEDITALSKQYNVAFSVGITEKKQSKHYIAQYVFAKGEVFGKHRKTHLSPSEQEFYHPGNQVNVFSIGGVNLGIQLCFESHMPEIAYAQAKKGADVLCIAYASPKETCHEKMERLARFLTARAYDNCCYVVACNMSGSTLNGVIFPGFGMMIDPKGNILCQNQGDDPGFCTATIDLALIDTIKNSKMGWFNNFKREGLLKHFYNTYN